MNVVVQGSDENNVNLLGKQHKEYFIREAA